MDVYVGLDVSLSSTTVCVLDEKGKVATEAQIASTPEALVSFMAKLGAGDRRDWSRGWSIVPLALQGND